MKQTAKAKAIDLFRAGFSVDEVAFMARITKCTAYNYKSSMEKSTKEMTKKSQIIDLIEQGLSNLQIADAIGGSANWAAQIRAIIKPYDGTYPRPFTKTKLACEFMRDNPELSVIEVSRALGLKRSICQHAKDKYLRRDSCSSAKSE